MLFELPIILSGNSLIIPTKSSPFYANIHTNKTQTIASSYQIANYLK